MINTDNYDLTISLDGRIIGSKTTDVFFFLRIFENAGKGIPVAELRFSTSEILNIYDGMSVDIVIFLKKLNPVVRLQMPFRVFSYRMTPMEGTDINVFDVTCVFRSVSLLSTSTFCIKGNSSRVFKYFGSLDSNLTIETDETNDSQVWRCIDERGFIFLQKVSRRSWFNSVSCFITAFTKTGQVRLFDLSRRLSLDPVAVFVPDTTEYGFSQVSDKNKSIVYKSIEIETMPGILNYVHTYNTTWLNYNVLTGKYSVFNPNRAVSSSKILLNKDYLEKSRREILPINVGNVHQNYYAAESQNSRFKSLYSVAVKVIVDMSLMTKTVDLLDRVRLVVTRYPEHINKMYTGNYFIEKCVTTIEGSSIHQRFMLIREGVS